MYVCYAGFIRFYGLLMHLGVFFNKKAEKWAEGQKAWEKDLEKNLTKSDQHCWIHCASAGEFEQAIPLIKSIRNREPSIRVIVSFFSPSGMDMYKDSGLADVFFYFPLDTKQNAATLVELLNPKFAIFIRNEIWWNVLTVLKEKNIRAYLVNANLEQKRSFIYKKYLSKTYPLFTKIFNTKTYGNTKLEKVIENKITLFNDEILEDFCKDSFVFILGSSWLTEESFAALFYKNNCRKFPHAKFIIAPHEFDASKHSELKKIFSDYQVPDVNDVIKYSNYDNKKNKRILFLDKKGILKYAYRYADIAYIGGGFDKSVHNISEAAVYGIPTIFGPNFSKFEEAKQLVDLKAAFPVNDYKEFENILIQLINNTEFRMAISQKLNDYFSQQENTADKIISEILK